MSVFLRTIVKYLKNPRLIILQAMRMGLLDFLRDEAYIKLHYRLKMRRKLNLTNPKTFNEKLQWLKINDKNPLYTQLVDKYEVRRYIADTVGEEYLIPLLGMWERFEDIDFDELPDQFVLKCTHDSGSVVICKDKAQFDIQKAGEKLSKQLKRNYYWVGGEWPYRDIKPRIIAEEYIEDESGRLLDYKFLCFGGVTKLIQVNFDRFTFSGKNLYTPEWEFVDVEYNYPNNKDRIINKPEKLYEMLQLSDKIASNSGAAFIRVDWFLAHGRLYSGELTLTPANGAGKFIPESYDAQLGSWIELPSSSMRSCE